jgi:two-component system phosphate regulon response regulator OmpR
MNSSHILIVDDDSRIRELLKCYLQSHGYLISSAINLKECTEQLTLFAFDLIILDIMLPDGSGVEFLTENKIPSPVILLTAMGGVDDRINGLESGAEDYLAKPFEPKELLLRISKILQRQKKYIDKVSWCRFGDFRFNMSNNSLFQGESLIQLTTMESNIIAILAQNLNNPVSREMIVQSSVDVNTRTIDAQIARVRAKIEADPRNPICLQTVRGKGYVLWGSMI